MAFRINTPIASMQSMAYLTTNNNDLDKSLARLSSGLRINSAADDASGMMIADNLRSQASSLGQAIRNINDAIGIAQIADKAIDEQTKIIDTIKSKMIQSAQDGQSAESRKAIQADISHLLESFNQIANSTTYNSQPLLSGSFTNKKFQVGAQSDQTADLTIQPTTSSKIGTTSFKQSKQLPIDQTNPFGNTAIKLNGIQLQDIPIGYKNGEGIGKLSDIINATSNETGVRASYIVEHRFTVPNQPLSGGTTPSDFSINDILIGAISFEDNDRTGNLVSAINAKSLETGIEAYTDSVGGLVLSSQDGRGIQLNTASPNILESLKIAVPNASFPAYQSDPANLQVERYQFSGTVQAGDIYTLGSISYTVQGSESGMDDIINALVTGLNGGTASGLSGTPIAGAVASLEMPGILKLTASVAGVSYVSPSYGAIDTPSVNDQALIFDSVVQPNVIEVPYQAEIPKKVVYSLSDTASTNVYEGDTYTLTIGGVSTSYTVTIADNTVSDVIDGMLNTLSSNGSLSGYGFSKMSSSQIEITGALGAGDYTVLSNETKTPAPSITFSVASNTQNNNIASNWRRASSTLALTNSTYDTTNVFQAGDTLSFNFSSTYSVNYTVQASDIDLSDPTGAQTNYNVLSKLNNLINSDATINGAVTSEVALEANAAYTAYISFTPIQTMAVNNNIAVLNIYEDSSSSWTPLSGNGSFSATGVSLSQTDTYNGTTIGYDRISTINEQSIVSSVPEITTFNYSVNEIVPGSKIRIASNTPNSLLDFSYTIKTTDTTIDDIVNGINAAIPSGHIIDGSGNTVVAKMGTLVNNNNGTLTLTEYVTQYASVNPLNSSNIGNSGSFYDTSATIEETSYISSPYALQNTMYMQDQSVLSATLATTVAYTAEVPYVAPQQQIAKYTLSGTVEAGDTYTLGGITYAVQPGDSSLSNIADSLVLGLNGNSIAGISGTPLNAITASKDSNGDILLTANVSGTPFAIPSASASNFSSNDQNVTKLSKSFNQYLEIGGFNTVGKLKLVEVATGKEIVTEGSGLEFIGMDVAGTPDGWVKNLMDMNSIDSFSMMDEILKQPIQESIDICDSALRQLDTIRSDIGSFQNQLESTMASISVERVMTLASESQIRDVDFARESAEFNKHKLLAQAGDFALSQSNADMKRIMSLLQ